MSEMSPCAWRLGYATDPYKSYASTSLSTPSSTLADPGAMPSITSRLPMTSTRLAISLSAPFSPKARTKAVRFFLASGRDIARTAGLRGLRRNRKISRQIGGSSNAAGAAGGRAAGAGSAAGGGAGAAARPPLPPAECSGVGGARGDGAVAAAAPAVAAAASASGSAARNGAEPLRATARALGECGLLWWPPPSAEAPPSVPPAPSAPPPPPPPPLAAAPTLATLARRLRAPPPPLGAPAPPGSCRWCHGSVGCSTLSAEKSRPGGMTAITGKWRPRRGRAWKMRCSAAS